MFGFKRKKEEDTMALVLKKKNIFSKIASLFRKNKQEELGEYYSNQLFLLVLLHNNLNDLS